MESAEAKETGASSPSGPCVLVVDDEVAILQLVKTILTRAQYHVTTAENAAQAMLLLERAPFDCVITDAVMPDVTGYDFVKIVRSDPRFAAIPVLMLTRKRDRQDVKRAVEAGVSDYVLKPIDESLLLEKVELSLTKNGKILDSELRLTGVDAIAELSVTCRIHALGENTLILRLPMHLEPRSHFHLRAQIFSELGIAQPRFRVEHCERISDAGELGEGTPELNWEAQVSLGEISESERERIQEWVRRQIGLRRV